jgi:hydrogenase expression/formation protein HypD
MKFISDYRDKATVERYLTLIRKKAINEYSIMEVCGGHTMAIHKFGLPDLLPENVKLLSGPGCPVCVTQKNYIDKAIELSKNQDVIICTFGDLIRVPGSFSSLEKQKAENANIRMVYSVMEAVDLAIENKNKRIIFLAIGFETTAPSTAVAIVRASELKLKNFFVLSAHKLMPPAMSAIIDFGVKINGYLCPGHVSTITGSNIFNFIPEKYKLGCVVSGFEPIDILQSIYMLLLQFNENKPKVEIQYKRAVTAEGNTKAQQYMQTVFEPADDNWRGIGIIEKSGLRIRPEYELFDAEVQYSFPDLVTIEDKGCICGEILKGLKTPVDCPMFNKNCKPENPVGACMVSSEGACQAYYKYRLNNLNAI